jgi:hypothetical protein
MPFGGQGGSCDKGADAVEQAQCVLQRGRCGDVGRCPRVPIDAAPGGDTSSTTRTCGVITSVGRSAIRRRTGSGSHGDWFTNCCRACMFPSGNRAEGADAAPRSRTQARPTGSGVSLERSTGRFVFIWEKASRIVTPGGIQEE